MASLAHKLAWKTSALIAGLVAMGLVSIGGLLSLSGHYAETEDRYDQLRAIYEIGHHVAMARARFDDPAASELHVHAGLEAVDQLLSPATSAGRRFSVEQHRMLEEIHDTLAAVDPMTGAARMPTAAWRRSPASPNNSRRRSLTVAMRPRASCI